MAPSPAGANALRNVTLDDKYELESGRVYLTGVQALVRLLMLQRRHSGQIDTAGFELVLVVESDVAQRVRAGGGGDHRACSKNRVSGLRGHR